MTDAYAGICEDLRATPKTWLLTGCAGFIGANILDTLLGLGQRVVGVDNFATGFQANLDNVRANVGDDAWTRFTLHQSDIRDLEAMHTAATGVDLVLHQAALGSVPRSVDDPLTSHVVNVDGTLNVMIAARDAGVSRMVWASSSSVYGDDPTLPKVEDRIGNPLSPYATTKRACELYARVFAQQYDLQLVGLRYFNVFGPMQTPDGPYAAVIPRWTQALLRDEPVYVFGDGETSRDFTYIQNVVELNLLAACAPGPLPPGVVINGALNDTTTLNELYAQIRATLAPRHPHVVDKAPEYQDFRKGDVRHSNADITRARELLGYVPSVSVAEGISRAMAWYEANLL